MPPHMVTDTPDIPLHMQHNVKKLSESSRKLRAQDFRPITTLGRGNMGTVLLVALKSSELPFAMKVMKKDTSRKNRSQRTQTERDILFTLEHPFLPSLHAHFESERHAFLVMDYCSGGDLNVLRQKQPEKRFSEAAAQFYAAEVLLALEYLHKLGIVYRDLKPENILVQESGHIMLTDFDLSLRLEGTFSPAAAPKPVDSEKKRKSKSLFFGFACISPWFARRKAKADANWDVVTEKKPGSIVPMEMKTRDDNQKAGDFYSFVGTEEYVAPEILCGKSHGFPVDWWTFGIFLYELIYGTTPFKGPSRKDTFVKILGKDPNFPGSWCPLKDLIQKLLVKEPAQRLGSAEGADEIKRHVFFKGLRWDSLENIFRPPFIPPPFSLIEFEKRMKEKRLLAKANYGHEKSDSSARDSSESSDTEESDSLSLEDFLRRKRSGSSWI